tara:strand:+ start:1233 stop:2096 length:864 start_codon:yes stop_codon:yes gene_type:complete
MSTSIKHAFSTITVLTVIFLLTYILSLDSILINNIPIVYVFILTILFLNSLFFIHSYFFKTDIFFDLIGSISFISIGIISLIFIPDVDGNQILVFFLLIFWALRLGPYLFIRRLGSGVDERLSEYFESPLSLYFVWIMNSLWVFMTSISMMIIFSSKENYDFGLVQWFGLLIWILGFIIEVVSDSQKSKFNKKNKGKFINIGLWKYIRHPNYLGEIIIWLGIFVISISYINSIFASLSVLSPIFVFVLLRFLTGVPQLEVRGEKKWGRQIEYINYKKETGLIFPKFK